MLELFHSPATMHSIKTTCLHFLIIKPWEMNSLWHKYYLPTRQFRAARSLWIQFFDSRYRIPAAASRHIPSSCFCVKLPPRFRRNV